MEKLATDIDLYLCEKKLEELEDAEDIAYIKSLTAEDYQHTVPLDTVIANFHRSPGNASAAPSDR